MSKTMRIVAIISVTLAAVAAKYHEVTSWGLPELEHTITIENGLDRSSLQCLNLAHNAFMIGMMDPSSFLGESKPALKEEETIALVPSPQGRDTWNVEELKGAAIIIIDEMGLDHKVRRRTQENKRLTLQKLESAIKTISENIGKARSTDALIKFHILEKLHSIMKDAEKGNNNIKKDGHELIMPVLDVSIWNAADLHQALKNPSTNPKLIPYLDDALHGMFASYATLDNGKICVVTPVNVMSVNETYYYVPPATKNLLKKVRKVRRRNM